MAKSFTSWFHDVTRVMVDLVALYPTDLPDQPYRDWFDEGMTPKEAVEEALENEGYGDIYE